MPAIDVEQLLHSAEQGINDYLEQAHLAGRIDAASYRQAKADTFPNLRQWMTTRRYQEISPALLEGLRRTIDAGRWEQLVNAYRQSCRFGTGGIRGMMGFDLESVKLLQEQGFGLYRDKEGPGAPILKGPNTINEVVLLRTSAGVARFGREQDPPFSRIVIGYDSRIRGKDFAVIVAQLFLAYGYTVYLFDEPCPYPEVTFAIPYDGIKAHVGILLSASHNDYRYNGYKLSCGNGSQFDPAERDEMYKKYIAHVQSDDIKLQRLEDAARDKLVFLGGDRPVAGVDYYGREDGILNIHAAHAAHVKSFLMIKDLPERQKRARQPLKIAYCAYHGAGRKAVPRLLREVGLSDINVIHENGLNELNGLFPSFCSDPGKERQPDPGDDRAALTAIEAYEKEYGPFSERDILLGTDPDADRCGVAVPVSTGRPELDGGNAWTLLSADSLWALLLWYRLQQEVEQHGRVIDAEKKFIVQSHTTSEGIIALARRFGLGAIQTWVGFAALSAAVRDVWENKPLKPLTDGRSDPSQELCDPFVCTFFDMPQGQRSNNVAAMEQSNGFSLLGGPPPDRSSLGAGGHVRDKDGTLAAFLIAEIAAWAGQQGTTILELIDQRIHLDPAVGLYVTHYEPDPLDGEYPGIEGDRKKKEILAKALGLYRQAKSGGLSVAGGPVTSAVIYRTGKYDAIYPPEADFVFPDEGIRFYFGDDDQRRNHATVRPSGTGNSLRFHVQLHSPVTSGNLSERKRQLARQSIAIVDDLRERLNAPRE